MTDLPLHMSVMVSRTFAFVAVSRENRQSSKTYSSASLSRQRAMMSRSFCQPDMDDTEWWIGVSNPSYRLEM